jgi:2-amino-4-hydroxy-6-hydroxymethyldihydropteridine diphosphokinase
VIERPSAPCSRDLFLALGSNVGDRAAHLDAALSAFRAWPEAEEVQASSTYECDYVGPRGPQDPYLNMCVRLRTALSAHEVLARTQILERKAGRDPHGHELPRTLDVDLLLDGQRELHDPVLDLPHPRLRERRFVLQPLSELRADLRLPPDGVTVRELLHAFDSGQQPLRRWR